MPQLKKKEINDYLLCKMLFFFGIPFGLMLLHDITPN